MAKPVIIKNIYTIHGNYKNPQTSWQYCFVFDTKRYCQYGFCDNEILYGYGYIYDKFIYSTEPGFSRDKFIKRYKEYVPCF